MAKSKTSTAKQSKQKVEDASITRHEIFDGTKSAPNVGKPLMGEVIVIMGTPKSKLTKAEDAAHRAAVSTIAEQVSNYYENVDVIKFKDVDLHAAHNFVEREGDQEAIDFVATDEGKAVMTLFVHHDRQYRQKQRDEEALSRQEFDKLSPEEQQKEIDRIRELRKEASGAAEKRRLEAIAHAFEVAQKWSTGTDLTPRERVHGAVHDLYTRYGETRGTDSAGRLIDVNPGRDYQKHYETHFVDEIKARSIRAAKDLFGNK